MTFAEAVEATAGKFTRVLFLMGSNSSQYSVVSDYTAVIDCMLENWPEATIYMQTVPDSPTGAVETDRINGVIADAVAEYEAAGETRVKLLDTNSCWGEGCFLSDGIHLTVLGLQSGTSTWPKRWDQTRLPTRPFRRTVPRSCAAQRMNGSQSISQSPGSSFLLWSAEALKV